MAEPASISSLTVDAAPAPAAPRHPALVRATHWIAALSFLALLVTGVELVISHPRFYWGDDGNVLTTPLFTLPIPASRASVPTGYDYVMPDQNGWSRSLHFESAWIIVFAGLLYVVSGVVNGRFRRELLPSREDLRWSSLSKIIGNHLRFKRPSAAEAWSYNPLQRLTYLGVVFILSPLMIWTGLAMSPAVTSLFPNAMAVFGGQQSARTLHFVGFALLFGFLIVHVMMVCIAGFRSRMRGMITGRVEEERP